MALTDVEKDAVDELLAAARKLTWTRADFVANGGSQVVEGVIVGTSDRVASIQSQLARAEAAERELEALRGQLAEAVNAIQTHSWGWQEQEPCDSCIRLLARLAPTEPKEDARG